MTRYTPPHQRRNTLLGMTNAEAVTCLAIGIVTGLGLCWLFGLLGG